MTKAGLQKRCTELQQELAEVQLERERYRALYLQMLEKNRKLEQGLMGQKAERLPAAEQQLSLQILSQLLGGAGPPEGASDPPADDEPGEHRDVAAHTRRKPVRKALSDDLPRVTIEVLPPEVEREGLDAFDRIGEEVSEVIERRPASVVVVRTVRPKFARRIKMADEPPIVIASAPELPIPRGLAGPGMLADSIVRRWQDHQPLNRLERIYARDGLELAKATMCGWHEQLAALARPLVDAMWADARGQPYLCTDATGVLVQAKERCHRSHFWVVVAPGRHVLFGYSRRHDSKAVDRLLGDYSGYLVADAHSVYDHLYRDGDVIEVGCWAHARRYFFKAMSSEPERARQALAMIGALFRVERELADVGRKKRLGTRRKKSAPIVRRFFAWCDGLVDDVLDDTPLARGIGYARNQRAALERFLTDGRLPLHNNGSELQLRRQALGRKNWLFVGSDDGGKTNAVFVSLLASCQMHNIEPWAYLRDLLCLLPAWPVHDVVDLAPLNWCRTLRRHEVQVALAANPFRSVTLSQTSE